MDKHSTLLLGAVAGLVTMGAAHAATPPAQNSADALRVSSYAELLAPVANAVALVKADDASRMAEPGLLRVDYDNYGRPVEHHHHHHHHHQQANYHHHHHHHHHSEVVGVPGLGVVISR